MEKPSIKYDVCIACGKTEFPHKARGLCRVCYKKQRQENKEKYAEYAYRFGPNRKNALSRDGYKCCICNSAEQLVVHHIDGNGRTSKIANNDLSNLQTLCRRCHKNIHHPPLTIWSKKYSCCVSCHSTDKPYQALGLCKRCYSYQQRSKDRKSNEALIRDNYKCLHCGSTENLVVHHVDGVSADSKNVNNNLSNLLTLCRSCYMALRNKTTPVGFIANRLEKTSKEK